MQKYHTFDYTTAYRAGNGVYLAEGEVFDEVVAQDQAILESYGLTKEIVGKSLGRLFATWNNFIEYRDPQPQYPVPGIMLTRQVYLLGQEWCPYVPGLCSGVNWHVFVEGMKNGNKAVHPKDGPTFVSEMMPEMIAKTGFFEGNVFFGVDPHWAVAIHRLVEEHNPQSYVPTFTKHAWDGVGGWFSPTGNEYTEIEHSHTYKEELAPGMIAMVAPGDMAPWGWDRYSGKPWTPETLSELGRFNNPFRPQAKKELEEYLKRTVDSWVLFVNNTGEDFRLPPDATLMGMPFDKYTTTIHEGRSFGRYLPDRPAPKQVG